MRQRLNLILLGVKDVRQAVEFYKALGWKRSKSGSEEFVLFDLGGIALGIQSRAAFAHDANYESSAVTGFPGFALAYIARSEEEVYRVMEKAAALRARIMKPAQATSWGHAGYFQDPDGHLFEVVYEDGWKFDEEDNLIL
jgi:predicted lactoylglutathione lyase